MTILGSERMWKALLTEGQLRDILKTIMPLKQAIITITGRVDHDDCVQRIEKFFKDVVRVRNKACNWCARSQQGD